MASRGHKATTIEKDPYIYLLVYNAFELGKKNAYLSNIAEQIELLNMDSCDFIENTASIFDCIYFDPMFPERNESAKVKKSKP